MPAGTNWSQPHHSAPSLQNNLTRSDTLQLEPEINPGKRTPDAVARPLSSFCLHRIRSGGTASPSAPPSICATANKKTSFDDGGDGICKSPKDDKHEGDREEAANKKKGGVEAVVVGRKVMVAADGGSEEARTALQWALSHAVRPCDTVVLLDVVRGGASNGKNRRDPRGSNQHLEAMRSICQAKRPEVTTAIITNDTEKRGHDFSF